MRKDRQGQCSQCSLFFIFSVKKEGEEREKSVGPRAKFDAGSTLSCPIAVPTHILGYTNRDWVMTRNPTYLWPYHIGNVDLCLLNESGPVQTAEAKEKRNMAKKFPSGRPLAASIDALLSNMLHEKDVWPAQCPWCCRYVALKAWEERL